MKCNYIILIFIVAIFNSCFDNNMKQKSENIEIFISDSSKLATKNSTTIKEELNQKTDKESSGFSNQKDCFVSFDEFFIKFTNDELFQKRRFSKSMRLTILDPYDVDKKIIKIVGKNHGFIDFKNDNEAINNEFDKFNIKIEKYKDSISYKRLGIDNGIYISYIFEKINNCWFLTEIIDESN